MVPPAFSCDAQGDRLPGGGQIKKVELAIGPFRFDTATDRSVQGSMNIARRDLEAMLFYRKSNVMQLEPIATSCGLNRRPATVHGKLVWPDKAMLEAVAGLSRRTATPTNPKCENR